MAGFNGANIPTLGLEQIYDRDNHLNGAGSDGFGKCRVTSLSVPGNPSSWADNITAMSSSKLLSYFNSVFGFGLSFLS